MERLVVGGREGMALESRDAVCKLSFFGGEGVLQLQPMNLVQLIKWVYRLMSLEVNLITQVLKDNYSPWIGRAFSTREKGICILPREKGKGEKRGGVSAMSSSSVPSMGRGPHSATS